MSSLKAARNATSTFGTEVLTDLRSITAVSAGIRGQRKSKVLVGINILTPRYPGEIPKPGIHEGRSAANSHVYSMTVSCLTGRAGLFVP
ncbi:hypothetical protein EVAR_16601_1 [Eumeta japonica]|uniref:Uncharacterized protein n=1 Tax=Eumeta variegata TaxID=151549 RepID=A0A4C1V0Q1_EUMVA|nr:hypothetical protein EVAR_16601_1 [Eumeta japonica]